MKKIHNLILINVTYAYFGIVLQCHVLFLTIGASSQVRF